jgi:VanZ family protein
MLPAQFVQPSQKRLWRYGPLVIWAALILIGSSDLLSASHTSTLLVRPLHFLFPGASSSTLAKIHFGFRKLAHLTEYAILAILAARAFRDSSRELLRSRWFWVSFLLVAAFSLGDEFRQSFVSSRTASIYDSLIDSTGGLIGLIIVYWWRRRQKPER